MRLALCLMAWASCVANVLGSAALAEEGRLILPERPGDWVIVTSPSTTLEAPDALRVFVGMPEACCAGRSPLAGRYERDGLQIAFAPAFDFVEGQAYTIQTLTADRAGGTLTVFTLGNTEQSAPEVVSIHPSGATIPENTLRFHIHFSAPMQPHLAADKIMLIDADGVEDKAAFMTFKQELWNADRTRLTLLMDPGRIKRGVAQNVALGPALREGRSYSIVVEDGWPSAMGGQKTSHFEQTFQVSAPLRTLPDPESWNFSRPRIMTRDPLVITLDRPFDQHGLATAITLLDTSGLAIEGQVRIERNETQWRFDPRAPWAGSFVDIVVDAHLEDVAGNNFRDLLDHAVGTELPAENDATHRLTLSQ